MIKLNPYSLKFRIGSSLLLLGFLILILIAACFFISTRAERKTQSLLLTESSVVQHAYDLSNEISNSNVTLKNHAYSPNSAFSEEQEKHWSVIGDRFDQLKTESPVSHKSLLEQLGSQLHILKERQQGIANQIEEEFAALSVTGNDLPVDPFAASEPDNPADSFALLQQAFEKTADSLNQIQRITASVARQYDEEIIPRAGEINQNLHLLIQKIREEKETILAETGFYLNLLKILIPAGLAALLIMLFAAFKFIEKALKRSVERVAEPLSVLSKGDLPTIDQTAKDELSVISDEIQKLSTHIGAIKNFALEVGSGRFNSEINVFNNEGEIGQSLHDMKNSLQKVAQEEKERNWMNEGFTRFADILRKSDDNLQKLSESVISNLVKYLKANQGGIFIVNDENKENILLELTGCYAYERKKYLNKQIMPGEGLVGQCYLEKLSIYMTDIPPDYINIKSGLGGANPGNLFLAPLKYNNIVYGVIEIASFDRFHDYELEFVDQIAESIASSISAVKINDHTRKLLEESQLAAEQLRAQEEEMRQNMEELAATQEEMHRNQKAVNENEQKTRLIFLNAFDAIITCNSQGQIDLVNPAAEGIFGYAAEDLKDKNIDLIIPGLSPREDRFKAEKANKLEGRRRNRETFPMHMKMESGTIGSEEIFLFFIEDISEEKAQNAQTIQQIEQLKARQEHVEKQYLEAKNQFERLVSQSAIPFLKSNESHEIVFANEAFESLWGGDQIRGLHLSAIFPQLKEAGGSDFPAGEKEKPVLELTATRPDGRRITAKCTVCHTEDNELLIALMPEESADRRQVEKFMGSREHIVKEKLAKNHAILKKLTAGEAYLIRKIKK